MQTLAQINFLWKCVKCISHLLTLTNRTLLNEVITYGSVAKSNHYQPHLREFPV